MICIGHALVPPLPKGGPEVTSLRITTKISGVCNGIRWIY